ncbi:hypothetical protein [Mesorhizobium sp. 1B3]|uniref:hypothetical protein n=1 Tax=Mesorhizobium sp. 1B3 TaxID=3243599 RepID=UPI003D96699E
MGRSAAMVPERDEKAVEVTTLDEEIAMILTAIEEETVPERLTNLAIDLQQALTQRKQRQNPS